MKRYKFLKLIMVNLSLFTNATYAKETAIKRSNQSDLPLILFFDKPGISPRRIVLKVPLTKPFDTIPLLKIVGTAKNLKNSVEDIKILERQATIDYVQWHSIDLKTSEIFNPLNQLIDK